MGKALENLLHKFVRTCENQMPSYEYRNIDGKVEKVARLYRHPKLYELSQKAFEKGEDYFYYDETSPSEPAKPKYSWTLVGKLTDEEMNALKEEASKEGDTVSRDIFKQVMMERDAALNQLKQLGYAPEEKQDIEL